MPRMRKRLRKLILDRCCRSIHDLGFHRISHDFTVAWVVTLQSSQSASWLVRWCNTNWLVVWTYPSEKSWSSSVGMMKFPTFYGKSNQIPWFQSPPIRILSMVSSLIYPLKAWWVSFPSVFSTMWGPPVISWSINPSNYSYKYYKP